MSRFLLLLVFIGWVSRPDGQLAITSDDLARSAIFIGGYGALVLTIALFNRRLAGRVDGDNLNASLTRYNRVMNFARMFVPAWSFVGAVFLGWGTVINGLLARFHLHPDRFDFPGLLVGCIPAFAAWMSLWWAQYPADICFREQGLLSQIDAGLPVHAPPRLASYFRINLRIELLFTIVPVLALVLMRDVISLALAPLGLSDQNSQTIELATSLGTAAAVMVLAPELLRRILHTEPLPAGSLRRRLEAVCRRHRIGYKDVLLWRTDHNMGNAAVMGLIPQTRYIFMSDLLLETMTDEQIEAVFAHEIGHVIHRHLLWFGVFFGAAMFALVGLSGPVAEVMDRWTHQAAWPSAVADFAGSIGGLTLFLFLSRKFERQADVFAARTIQEELAPGPSHVGAQGASVFSSALYKVARINCIPIHAWSWCHGSIAHRVEYLEDLSRNPQRTAEFDRFMARLYGLLMFALLGFGVWAMVTLARQGGE